MSPLSLMICFLLGVFIAMAGLADWRRIGRKWDRLFGDPNFKPWHGLGGSGEPPKSPSGSEQR